MTSLRLGRNFLAPFVLALVGTACGGTTEPSDSDKTAEEEGVGGSSGGNTQGAGGQGPSGGASGTGSAQGTGGQVPSGGASGTGGAQGIGGQVSNGGEGGGGPTSGVGTNYILNIAPEDWSPPSVGGELGAYFPPFLLRVESLEGGTGEVLIGTAQDSSTQQSCNPTSLVAAYGDSVPSISTGPDDVPLYFVNAGTASFPVDPPVRVLATGYALSLRNVFPDGLGDSRGTLTLTLDMREMVPLFTTIVVVSPEGICAALESLGEECQACADGELYCMTMTASALEAMEFSGDMVAINNTPAACLD